MEPQIKDSDDTAQHQKPIKKSPKKKKSNHGLVITTQDIIGLLKSGSSNEEGSTILSYLLSLNFKAISFKQIPQLKQILKLALISQYPSIYQDLSQKKNQKQNFNCSYNPKQMDCFVRDFREILKCMKQCQFPAPVSDVFFGFFIQVVKHHLKEIDKKEILGIWTDIPIRNFDDFIAQLQLKDAFNMQPQQIMLKFLTGLINDLKIPQCCTYYSSYKLQLTEFQRDLLVPKIVNSDQLLSPAVVNLLKNKPSVKQQVIMDLDKAKAVLVLQHINEDPRIYPQIWHFIMRKHYLAMKKQYEDWYVFEDKMSFNPIFITMYCDQAINEKDQEQQIKQSVLDNKTINSLKWRNQIQQMQIDDQQIVDNPLFKYDSFTVTENVLNQYHSSLNKPQEDHDNYLLLKQYGVDQNMVEFVDDPNSQKFNEMATDVLSSQGIGFDAENRCTSTKYEQQGVSLIQISTNKKIYILDYLSMEKNEKFIGFFKQFLGNPHLMKIGHTVNSDIRYLQKTTCIDNYQGFKDISNIFKQKYPNQTHNSLAFMVEKLIGKKLSKFQQRSNWNRRPLKKSQLHYAALDAKVCVHLFQILNSGNAPTFQTVKKNKIIKSEEEIIRLESLAYAKKFEYLLEQKQPKFLVDSMVKKLCSMMRNLGIDTEYSAVSNFELMKTLCEKEGRILLTRDTKLLKKSKISTPIYCLQERGDSDLMLEEVKKAFKLNLEQFQTLSRCVKCNCGDLQVITKQEAMKVLVFHYENNTIQQFWRCVKCKQIYWEGNQFKNAKEKFENMK